MKLNAVLDTNVLISGILWRGVPFNLLRWAEEGTLRIYTSLDILAEVYRVLYYPKFNQYIDNQKASPWELFAKIVSLCTIIQVDRVVKGVQSILNRLEADELLRKVAKRDLPLEPYPPPGANQIVTSREPVASPTQSHAA
jgi:putative PIN family toxin of toxin-antitoxin system